MAQIHVRDRNHPQLLRAQPHQQIPNARLGNQCQCLQPALLGVDKVFERRHGHTRHFFDPQPHQGVEVALMVQPLRQRRLAQFALGHTPRQQHLIERIGRKRLRHQCRQTLMQSLWWLDATGQQGIENIERHAANAPQTRAQPSAQRRQRTHPVRTRRAPGDRRQRRHRHWRRERRLQSLLLKSLARRCHQSILIKDLAITRLDQRITLFDPAIPVVDQRKQLRLFRDQGLMALGGGDLHQVFFNARPLL